MKIRWKKSKFSNQYLNMHSHCEQRIWFWGICRTWRPSYAKVLLTIHLRQLWRLRLCLQSSNNDRVGVSRGGQRDPWGLPDGRHSAIVWTWSMEPEWEEAWWRPAPEVLAPHSHPLAIRNSLLADRLQIPWNDSSNTELRAPCSCSDSNSVMDAPTGRWYLAATDKSSTAHQIHNFVI